MARLRLFIVALLLAAAYAAQAVFDHGSLQPLIPLWALERIPWLFDLALLLPEDLFTAAGWTLAISALLIGLILPAWSGPAPEPAHRAGAPTSTLSSTPTTTWRAPALGGLLLSIGVGVLLATGMQEQPWMGVVWAGAIALVAVAAWRSHRATAHHADPAGDGSKLSAAGWLPIMVILLLTAVLAGRHWTVLPVRIDEATARFGIQMGAVDLAASFALFSPGDTGAPGLAYLPGGLLTWLLRDGLQASHALGMAAALAVVGGTWLAGRELFRRPSLHIGDHVVVDDGRRAALLAAGLTGVAISTIHFGRLAPFLPATALGVLACWQLLRGVRMNDVRSGFMAGALAGGSLLLDRSGLVFLLIGLLWWAGFALVGTTGGAGSRQPLLRLLGWWLAGAVVVLGPVAGAWLHEPPALHTYLTAADLYGLGSAPALDFWLNLAPTVKSLFWIGDASPVFGISTHLLSTIVTPLFMAGLALLLFGLDQLAGWCLLTWSIAVLIVSAATNAVTPDWPTLLPLVPAAGLIIALLADRLRMLIVQGFGAWTALTSFYVAAGLLVAVAAANWITYWEFAQLDGDGVSYLAHALRASDESADLVQVASSSDTLLPADHIVLRFAADEPAARMVNITVADLEPPTGPAARFFVLPPDGAALEAVRTTFPQGALSLERDLHGNPRMWIYDVP